MRADIEAPTSVKPLLCPGLTWQTATQVILIGAPLALLLSLACIYWLDLPAALWIHEHSLDTYAWMLILLGTPIALSPAAGLYLIIYAIRRGTCNVSFYERAYCIVSATLLASLAVKDMLKRAFGRTWPRNVIDPGSEPLPQGCGSPSLGYINDGIHAFHAFGGTSKPFQAFPSGSATVLIAVVVPLMVLYPRLRGALAMFSLVSLVAFVLTNTHFIGDVIAGTYVGVVAGVIASAMIRDAAKQ